ncbi:uncharacterized protein LOC133181376 [Saccostrea echinata]|uniref:uncharacterized protein LOC133181376 n=1 Tax=Saccostrea echinata TaxID=191078 RepID=UPI002A823E15|nr:uncharacterized protein LOC133181376 [Saccostrea echinata]
MSKINELRDRLREQETYYGMACLQLTVLNQRFEQLAKRYDRADKLGQKSFRYSLRMKMAILEGVRNMFYEFATYKACSVNKLRQEILIEHAFLENNGQYSDSGSLYGRYGNPVFLLEGADGDEADDEIDDEDIYGIDTESDEDL